MTLHSPSCVVFCCCWVFMLDWFLIMKSLVNGQDSTSMPNISNFSYNGPQVTSIQPSTLTVGKIDFKSLTAALSFTPPEPTKPTPIEANGNKVEVLKWQLLTLLAAMMQFPAILYKVTTQMLCPAHWFKKDE